MAGPRNPWIVGILLEVLATLSGTAGKQLIRLSELSKTKAPYRSNVAFHSGMVINAIAGPILDMAAYSFAPQSLIAPFGGLDCIWNAALAPIILHERLTWSRLGACALIFVGTVLSGFFGTHHEREYTVESLQNQLLSKRVLIYMSCFLAWVVFNCLVPMRRPKGDVIRGVSLGITAGTIAGNMFCVKASVELIERSIWTLNGEIWLHWLPYCLLAGAAFFALSNVVFMTRGLLEFEALFMVTIYEGSMVVSNIFSASVVLLELEGLEHWRVACYVTSVLMVCAGMANVSLSESRRVQSENSSQNPLEKEAATILGDRKSDPADDDCSAQAPGSGKASDLADSSMVDTDLHLTISHLENQPDLHRMDNEPLAKPQVPFAVKVRPSPVFSDVQWLLELNSDTTHSPNTDSPIKDIDSVQDTSDAEVAQHDGQPDAATDLHLSKS